MMIQLHDDSFSDNKNGLRPKTLIRFYEFTSSYRSAYGLNTTPNFSGKSFQVIPHEVMHAIGLLHTLVQEASHRFTYTKTDNYMDYNNTAKHTYKWQWQRLHNSNLTQ
ncbi:hypothetical protein AAG747_10625 [Rapidithrix thailandica]|uniref:Uncharacterized protein n=1 Tax=Rapidithrix thailandica TaxID=413964 RepID=A0AAW9S5Z2_9BACT